MDGKIALEEHCAIPDTIAESRGAMSEAAWTQMRARLLDFEDRRLAEMDRHGIEKAILSLNGPTIQRIGVASRALEVARRANELLAAEVQKRKDRFEGFAALPMQDPELAADELQRCVKDYGFKGALVNGYSEVGNRDNCLYYDLPQYWPFWSVVEALNVPFYLHPREPSQLKAYAGHPWLVGPAYGFGAETALHALRLMGSGLFDQYPRLTVIIGHLGEALPYIVHRTDERIAWSPAGYPAKRKTSEYLAENFFITTAGHCRTQALINVILEIGADRILFSTDYPFQSVTEAANWFDSAPISERDRHKIGRQNAIDLFKLRGA